MRDSYDRGTTKLAPLMIEQSRDPSPTPGRGGAPKLFILFTDPLRGLSP